MLITCSLCSKKHFYRDTCPLIYKVMKQNQFNREAKQDYFGASPNLFVGRFGYPNINVGMLNTEHDRYQENDNHLLWSRENYSLPQIMDLRLSLINSSFKANIKSFDDRFLQMSQEVAMASQPVDVELHLSKKPQHKLTFHQDASPHGTTVRLVQADIAENPKIPTKIDKAVSDTDLKAGEALATLYRKEVDEHYLTKLLSAGTLGLGKNRKLVPTRWSITAVDDTLGKSLVEEVKNFSETDYTAFAGGYLGNYYLVLFFPGVWEYELFETYAESSLAEQDQWMKPHGSGQKQQHWTTDYEPYSGRKTYAEETAGGFYAARLGVLEHLKKIRRQASCLVLRFITREYYAHLGVWVCREAVRKAMQAQPIVFSSRELLIEFVRKFTAKKFNYPVDVLLRTSKVMQHVSQQRKLGEFVGV